VIQLDLFHQADVAFTCKKSGLSILAHKTLTISAAAQNIRASSSREQKKFVYGKLIGVLFLRRSLQESVAHEQIISLLDVVRMIIVQGIVGFIAAESLGNFAVIRLTKRFKPKGTAFIFFLFFFTVCARWSRRDEFEIDDDTSIDL